MISSLTVYAKPTKAASDVNYVLSGKVKNTNISEKIKALQEKVKYLNDEKESLNVEINVLYSKKKNQLIKQLNKLKMNKQIKDRAVKLDAIKSQITELKTAIESDKVLNDQRKKLWDKYKLQQSKNNNNGVYNTLLQIESNLEETISLKQNLLQMLSA
jgi:SMC interacting uncharacterized protein involved in chromosome segregation